MNQEIELRKFPYPYKAALTLCSDLDSTPSLPIYLEMMDYLNGGSETRFGRGLNLEIGNSFWFFNGTPSRQLSYFRNSGPVETDFAPHCRELWQSGHIDVLHTYGDFDEGGFTRQHAETALNVLQKYNVKLRTWVNHGSKQNRQNLGYFETFDGARRETHFYHADLLQSIPIRYAWMGRITHVIGQDARSTRNIRIARMAERGIFLTKHRRFKEHLYDPGNRLLIDCQLQDGWTLWEFPRWIHLRRKSQHWDSSDLSRQLHPKYVHALLKNEGFLILYTHLCEGLTPGNPLPGGVKQNLEHIAELYHSGELLVSTTTRLLRYAEIHHHITFQMESPQNGETLSLPSHLTLLGKQHPITGTDLQGLTFYCRHPERTGIRFQGRTVPSVTNPPDHTGRPSVSVPWIPLEYPMK
jgi:hypothetical protein